MQKEQPDYRSYLLRLWRTGNTPAAWRASLESTRTGELLSFASLTALTAFLEAQTCELPGPPLLDE